MKAYPFSALGFVIAAAILMNTSGFDVINMSLGGLILRSDKGDNAAWHLAQSGGFTDPAPGAHDTFAFYSNRGAAVDIAAPGGDCGPLFPDACQGQYFVASTFISGTGGVAYAAAIGTSMASPHVAAVAAQVKALHPDWTPGHVRAHLKATATNIGSRQLFGAGLLNGAAAVR